MFRGKNNFVNWDVKDGDLVEIHCDIGLYEARGEYQLNVNKIQFIYLDLSNLNQSPFL